MAGKKDEIRQKAIMAAQTYLMQGDNMQKDNAKINGFAERKKAIEAMTFKKHPLVKEYLRLHGEAEMKDYTRIGRLKKEWKKISARQRILEKAAELCEDQEVKEALNKEAKELLQNPIWDSYEKYIQGLEFLAGITMDVAPEVKHFFKYQLCEVLPVDNTIYEKCRTGEVNKDTGVSGKEYDENLDEHTKNMNLKYQAALAPAMARELFTKNLSSVYFIEAQFVGEGTMAKLPDKSFFKKRMTPSAFCAAKMLLTGASLEDILDPNALKEKKEQIGKEYLALYNRGDVAAYADEMYKAAGALIKAFDKFAKDHKAELKTEADLAMHANMLGVTAYLCADLGQELERVKEYSKTASVEAINDRIIELGKREIGTGMVTGGGQYEIDTLNSTKIMIALTHQLRIKMFLEEVQKDEPDFENHLLTTPDWADVKNQLGTMDVLEGFFDEDDIDMEKIDENEVKVLASMMTNEFVNQNNIRFERPRVPVKVTKVPEVTIADPLEPGKKLEKIVTFDGKQLVQTTLEMDLELKNLEKKNLRGKTSGNSEEFNNLLTVYDLAKEKLSDPKLSNTEFLAEMLPLKTAAAQYMIAKRAQKGYTDKTVPNDAIDQNMLGKGKGASIFTSRGKLRYEFAMDIISRIAEMEEAIKEEEKKKAVKKQYEMEMELPKQDQNSLETKEEMKKEEEKQPNIKEESVNTKKEEKEKEEEEEPSYTSETISKAKKLVEKMNEIVERDGELALFSTMKDMKTIDPELVPMDFLVNDLKLGTEAQVLNTDMRVIKGIVERVAACEKTNEKEAAEMEEQIEL